MSRSPLRQDRRVEPVSPGLPELAPLIWAIGYSGLHATVLFRGVMAYQDPSLLTRPLFWVVSLAFGAFFAALMTAGWGRKARLGVERRRGRAG